jgi:hypothetical protein
MGTRGPIPKRSEERIRRNEDEGPIETLQVQGEVDIPDLNIPEAHPLVVDWYNSLKESAQNKYYEPSDWQTARIVAHFLDRELKSFKPNGQMVATLHSYMTDLLVSEGARRRVRLEIERNVAEAKVIDLSDRFKELLAQ